MPVGPPVMETLPFFRCVQKVYQSLQATDSGRRHQQHGEGMRVSGLPRGWITTRAGLALTPDLSG